jgi:hypothetical protein
VYRLSRCDARFTDRERFFLFPADSEGNNIRVYVLVAQVAETMAGVAAEELVREHLGSVGR